MIKGFRTYELAIEFYSQCERLKLPQHLRSQLLRASSSISLNLGEGSAKQSEKDRLRFYQISFGSLRESQTILRLANLELSHPN